MYYGVSYQTTEVTKEQIQWFSDFEKNENEIWSSVYSKVEGKFLGVVCLNDLSK